MPEGAEKKEDGGALKSKELTVPAKAGSVYLAGAEKFKGAGSGTHVGLSVKISSNRTELSTITVPDLDKIGEGPVYITSPVKIYGKHLKTFLGQKGITIPENVGKFISDAEIVCEAFYYTSSGPLLMVFDLNLKQGVFTDLIGKELGDVFDIHGASVRVLRCPDDGALQTLQEYCASLPA